MHALTASLRPLLYTFFPCHCSNIHAPLSSSLLLLTAHTSRHLLSHIFQAYRRPLRPRSSPGTSTHSVACSHCYSWYCSLLFCLSQSQPSLQSWNTVCLLLSWRRPIQTSTLPCSSLPSAPSVQYLFTDACMRSW